MTDHITFASPIPARRALAPHQPAGARHDYRSSAASLLHGPARLGCDIDMLLATAGLGRGDLAKDGNGVSRMGLIKLLTATKTAMQDECFGLAEQPSTPGTFAFMAEIGLHCGNLHAFLEQGTRFYKLAAPGLGMNFVAEGDAVRLQCMPSSPELDPGAFLVDYNLLQWHRLLSWMVGYMIPVRRVELVGGDSRDGNRLTYFIRGDGGVAAPVNALVISIKYMTLPIVRTRAELVDYFVRGAAGDAVVPSSESTWTSGVKGRFLQALSCRSGFELEEVAAQLQVSSNTLRRHLRHEGNGFQKLLDDFRRDVAIEKLHVQRATVADVAELLGFSEARSFSRAFKQWTGLSPSIYVQNSMDKCNY